MKTLQDIRSFYHTGMVPDLQRLEEERIKVANKLYAAGSLIIAIAVLIGFAMLAAKADIRMFFMLVVLTAMVISGVYYFMTKNYTSAFKINVIQKIVKFIDPNLTYESSDCIDQHTFKGSKIFKSRVDEYKGDDCVSGIIGETKLQFSELHAAYITRDSKGRRSRHPIFDGLFFVADFNKSFKGETVVLPDTAEKLFGQFGAAFQKMNKSRGQLIKLEDPDFEKEFAVYGDDQIEARYILSTSLMKRIVDFKRKTKKKVHLSFIGSRIYIAVTYRKNLFEPKVFKTLLDFTPIQEYFEDMAMAISIVEDLNLNTRIWSK